LVKEETFTVHLTVEMREELRETSEVTGLSQSDIVRRGIYNQLLELR